MTKLKGFSNGLTAFEHQRRKKSNKATKEDDFILSLLGLSSGSLISFFESMENEEIGLTWSFMTQTVKDS